MEKAKVIPNIPLKRSLLSPLPIRIERAIKRTKGPDQFHLSPKRRRRTTVSTEQLQKLEALYDREQWPSRVSKEALAAEINTSTHFVNVWFQNKRSRVRKALLEESELAEYKRHLTSSVTTVRKYRNIPLAPKPSYQSRSSSSCRALPQLRVDLTNATDSMNQNTNLYQSTFSENMNKYSASPFMDNHYLYYGETADGQPAWFEYISEGQHRSRRKADVGYVTCGSPERDDVLTTNSNQHRCHPRTISSISSPPFIFQERTNLSTIDDRGVDQKKFCLLQVLIYMMMIKDGHKQLIQDKHHARFAINACLYGINLRDGNTIIIDKEYGFGIKENDVNDD